MEWARPPPIITLSPEVDSAPARAPPPPPELPDVETTLLQLAALGAELQTLPDPVFDDISPIELPENWWRLHSPPPEHLFLSGDEPEEVRDEVLSSEQRRQESFHTNPEGPEIESGLEVVLEEYISAHSSSGAESTCVGSSNELLGSPGNSSPLRPRSSLGIRSSRDSLTIASSGSGSSSVKQRRLPFSLSSRQRDVKHALIMPGVLLFSPYYTASAPSGSGLPIGEHLISPRAEAIKKYLKNRKAQSECASCLEDHRNKNLTTLTCQHRYCGICLRTLINTAVTDETLFPPKCCLNEIPEDIINATLRRSERNIYKLKVAEYNVPWGDRIHCPNPHCSAWIPPSAFESTQGEVRCRRCRNKICRYCKVSTHPTGTECPEDTGIAAVIEVAHRNGWRRCYNCHAVVERSSGCRHITCRCKAEFCYICGAKWKTCSCTGGEAVANRPQLAVDNVAVQEQEEVHAAIAAVEEAERQEAEERRRAEIAEMIEHERRLENERAAREREAAILHAEIAQNLKAIEQRYNAFQKAFEELQTMQFTCVQSRHRTERDEIIQSWRDHTSCLSVQILSRLEDLQNNRAYNMASFKTCHKEEISSLETRHEEEEDEYWFSLQQHLRGKPNREERSQALIERLKSTQASEMEEVRKRQESEVEAWQRRISADCVEALRLFTTRKKRILMEAKDRMSNMARTWNVEEKWMAFIEDERRSHMLAKEIAEEEAERARMTIAIVEE